MQKKIKAMGFCIYNNVAVGAHYLLNKYKLNKIAIIDFDVHHGNGNTRYFFIIIKKYYIFQLTSILIILVLGLKAKKANIIIFLTFLYQRALILKNI